MEVNHFHHIALLVSESAATLRAHALTLRLQNAMHPCISIVPMSSSHVGRLTR